jgi:hypothetical protein
MRYTRSKISPSLSCVTEREKGMRRTERARGEYEEGLGSFRMRYSLVIFIALLVPRLAGQRSTKLGEILLQL